MNAEQLARINALKALLVTLRDANKQIEDLYPRGTGLVDIISQVTDDYEALMLEATEQDSIH